MAIGKLDALFVRLDAMFGKTKHETKMIRVKCPCGCNHEFDVEIKQQVIGAVTDFSAYTGSGGILSQCPWSKP